MTPFTYHSVAWRKLRRTVLARDGYRCAWCRCDVSGKGRATVDHIRPVKTHPYLAWSMDNLRCLCPDCDNKRHREKGWTSPTGCDADGWPLRRIDGKQGHGTK